MLPNFVDLMLDAVVLVDVQGRIVYVNAACESIFGYTPDEMIGQSMIDLVAPEDRARTWEESMQVMAGTPRIGFENRYIRKDGRQVHIMWSARWSPEDQLRIGVARDVTKLKQAQSIQAATYAVSEAAHKAADLVGLFREIHSIIGKLAPVAGIVAATRDPVTRQMRFSYQMDLYGDSPTLLEPWVRQYCSEAISSGQSMLIPDKVPAAFSDHVQSPPDGSAFWLVMPLIAQSGTMGALALKSCPGTVYSGQDRELLQFVAGQVATAMERMQLQAELMRSARYDELTGLPNRRLFHERAKSALARCRRQQSRVALLYVDIDKFKHVNDTLGHATGDLLLQEVARRLEKSIREEDTIARIGGDEFVVLLEEVHRDQDAAAVATKIRNAMLEPVRSGELLLQIRVSIGISFYPGDGIEIEQLMRRADDAMYFDKMRGLATELHQT